MQAVIMAGGKGTRLLSVTKDEIPKPMVPIAGKPLLLWQIEELKRNGILEVILVVGHLGDVIEDYFGDGQAYGVKISYIREEKPLGTAGTFPYLKGRLTGRCFLLVFGDVFFSIAIDKMEQYHNEKKALATLFVHPNAHPQDSDLVVLDKQNKVVEIVSKHSKRDRPLENCVNAGFYILDNQICESVSKPEKTDLEKEVLIPLIAQHAAVYGYRSAEYIKDIGTKERISQARQEIAAAIHQNSSRHTKRKENSMDYTKKIVGYIELEKQVLESLDTVSINRAMNLIMEAYEANKQIYIFGNGGSAATASHYQNDFNKGISEYVEKKFHFVCLNDNMPTIMAIANDIGFSEVFRFQLENRLEEGDLVIAISGSGNSENVIRAVEYARQQGNQVIGLCGYDGGKLKGLSDVALHVAVNSMQVTEDVHMVLDHLMMSVFYEVLCGKGHLG